MCGRYTLITDAAALAQRFGLPGKVPELSPRYNVAPRQAMPIIRPGTEEGQPQLDFMQWGLVPRWAKSPASGDRMINARAETITERPAYRGAIRYHRCLVPASGFYEWKAGPRGKQPYYIDLADAPLFAFAGLYDTWHAPDGTELRTYTIITTTANAFMAPLHDRMPVILPPDAEAAWLDPTETRAAAVVPLLQPCPAEAMVAQAVSTAVNDPRHEGPALIAPLADQD